MEERKTLGQQILDLVGMLLRGLGVAVGWFLGEVETTLRLFSTVPPMFFELCLAVVVTFIYLFPSPDMLKLTSFAGTELAIPFVLGLFYAAVNMVWVASRPGKNGQWYWSLIKASIFPAALSWAVFTNRSFQEFVGWGDPAATFRSCIWLVWGVVIANALFVQTKARIKQ